MGEDNFSKSTGGDIVIDAHQNNKQGRQLFIFAMVFVTIFFIYVTFFHPHSSPDYVHNVQEMAVQAAPPPPPKQETPPNTETAAVAETAKAPEASGPWVSTPETIAKGQAMFKVNCAICHGEKGLGDGPAGQSLKPPPRNYSEGKWKFGNSTIALFNTVSKGSPGTSMAAYEGILPEADRWAIIHYVKSIGKNIVDPTDAEIKAFKGKKK